MPDYDPLADWTGPLYRTVDYGNPSEAGNPFADASYYTGTTQTFVLERLNDIANIFDANNGISSNIISKLEGLSFDFGTVPEAVQNPELDFNFRPDYRPIAPAVTTRFGGVAPPDIEQAPDVSGIDTISAPNIPSFNPSVTGLSIPTAPPPIQVAEPGDAPLPLSDWGFPDKSPTLTTPSEPELERLNLPTWGGLSLPLFEPGSAEFEGTPVNAVLTWEEPEYTEEIIQAAIAQIQTFLAGGSGINPDVENAILARGQEREDRLVTQDEKQAELEWANRGYTAPPGMLAQRLDNLREEGLIKKLGLNRELVIKVHDDELQNLRFAVQQGIAAEQLYVQIHLAAVARLFEAERLTIQWAVDFYNSAITLFNAKVQKLGIEAQVYEVQVRAALADLEVFRTLVDAELAKAEINKSLVESYKAQIEANESFVRLYEAEIRAVGERINAYGAEIQAYRGTIEAYATKVDAEKTKFDAYDSRIRGELGKASIVEAEARAYQAEVQGIETGVRADVATIEGQIATVQADISAYEANVRGQLGKAQIELQNMEGLIRGYEADVRRYAVEVGFEEAKERTELGAWEAGLRSEIAFFQAQIGKYEADLRTLTKEAELSIGALQSSGQLSSTISAGALAAMHVGATISGSSATNASGNDSVGWQQSFGKSCGRSVSVSVDQEEVPSDICSF